MPILDYDYYLLLHLFFHFRTLYTDTTFINFLTWIETDEYEPPMTPNMWPVLLNFKRGVPPPLLHSYLKVKKKLIITKLDSTQF